MLLSIDTAKIEEKLKDLRLSYVVTSCNIEAIPVDNVQPFNLTVVSTTAALPQEVERARSRLQTLRQSLIGRGIQPLSNEALDRKIDEVRGR